MVGMETEVMDILGEQVLGLVPAEAKSMVIDGREAGKYFESATHSCCVLSPVMPADVTLSRAQQTESVFEAMSAGLRQCGMEFADTVRTWFYLDQLLDWYDEFNKVRTAHFEKDGVFDRLVPASTGIGIANPAGGALAAALIAVKPKDSSVTVSDVASPHQGSAMDYRSSFSRAVEVSAPDARTLYVSGTASIDEEGNSVHVGDVALQIDETMKVVAAILESRGMSWESVSRSVLYYTDLANHDIFLSYCQKANIPAFPHVLLESDICRRELLFEIELDAISLV